MLAGLVINFLVSVCLSTVTFELADLWRWFYACAMCIGHDDISLKVKSQRDLIDRCYVVNNTAVLLGMSVLCIILK